MICIKGFEFLNKFWKYYGGILYPSSSHLMLRATSRLNNYLNFCWMSADKTQLKNSSVSRFGVKKLVPEAILPVKGTKKSAGYDICSIEETSIPSMGKGKVRTGLSFEIPPDTYARIAPRSGLTWKNSINVGAGVIDEDYRG